MGGRVKRPRILVSLDTGEVLRRDVPFPSVHMKTAYVRAVEAAGGTPILVAPTRDREVLDDLMRLMDGLVVTGGAFDIDPVHYGQVQEGRLDAPKPERTAFEWALLSAALAHDIPVLGICGGMQLLNVVLGGTLIQDIRTQNPSALDHEQPTSPRETYHRVELIEGTALARALGARTCDVNSTHHQAVEHLGRGLVVLGRSPDGTIEAIGRSDDLAVVGVQWHPELLEDHVSSVLYGALVERAR